MGEIESVDKTQQELQKEVSDVFMAELFKRARNNASELANALIARALSGDMQAIKEINERVLGKVQSTVLLQEEDLTMVDDDRFEAILKERVKKNEQKKHKPDVADATGVASDGRSGGADNSGDTSQGDIVTNVE